MNKIVYFSLIVLFVIGILTTLIFLGPLKHLEILILDQYFHFKKASLSEPEIMIVAVDSDSLSALGDMPWSAEVYTNLLDKLAQGNPDFIAFFFSFSDKSNLKIYQHLNSKSEQLRQKILLPDFLIFDPYDVARTKVVRTPEKFTQIVAGSGIVHLETSTDGVCRFKKLRYKVDDKTVSSLEVEILRNYWQKGKKAKEQKDKSQKNYGISNAEILINYVGSTRTFPYIPVYKVLNGEIEPQIFQNKIVLIGIASPLLKRGMITPTTDVLLMPEVEVHANAIHTLLNNRFIETISTLFLFLIVPFFSVVLGLVYWNLEGKQGLLLLISLSLLTVFIAYGLFIWKEIWIYILPFLFIQFFAYIYILGIKLVEMNNLTEQSILSFSSHSPILYQRSQPSDSQTDFWKDIAVTVSNFFHIDSMLFLEREGSSKSLSIVYHQPDSLLQDIKQSEHHIDSPPYNYAYSSLRFARGGYIDLFTKYRARGEKNRTDYSPVIIQNFIQDSVTDTLLIPLVSSYEVIGFWILNKANGRDYFEEIQESTVYFAHQISLKLIKRQITENLEEKRQSLIKRLSCIFGKPCEESRFQSLMESILEERARVSAALNGIADGVILYDLFGKLVLYNDKAREITRETVENLADINLHELILQLTIASKGEREVNQLRSEIIKRIHSVIAKKQNATFLITLGEHPAKYYQITLTPVEEISDDISRRLIGVVCLLSDISVYEQIVDFMQMLQTISERGRNHLTPIIGYAPILRSVEGLSDEHRELVDIIRRNAEALVETFEEFKDKLSFEPVIQSFDEIPNILEGKAPVDLTEVAKEVIAQQKDDIEITLHQPSQLVEKVWGDRILLRAAMTRLIEILKQHLPEEGNIDLTVEWEEDNYIRVDISEQGYGVPQEAVSSALEQLELEPKPIEKSEESSSWESQIDELTLSQIKYIIEELHNGQLTGESHVGGGLKFSFRIRTVI